MQSQLEMTGLKSMLRASRNNSSKIKISYLINPNRPKPAAMLIKIITRKNNPM